GREGAVRTKRRRRYPSGRLPPGEGIGRECGRRPRPSPPASRALSTTRPVGERHESSLDTPAAGRAVRAHAGSLRPPRLGGSRSSGRTDYGLLRGTRGNGTQGAGATAQEGASHGGVRGHGGVTQVRARSPFRSRQFARNSSTDGRYVS